MELLLHSNVSIETCDNNGRQPLHTAIVKGNLSAVKCLFGKKHANSEHAVAIKHSCVFVFKNLSFMAVVLVDSHVALLIHVVIIGVVALYILQVCHCSYIIVSSNVEKLVIKAKKYCDINTQ